MERSYKSRLPVRSLFKLVGADLASELGGLIEALDDLGDL